MHTRNSLVGRIADFTGVNNFFCKFKPVENINNSKKFVISPVQGRIKHIGKIDIDGDIISKNNKKAKLNSLIGRYSKKFRNCQYMNIYLNPLDKHFWIAPFEGKLVHAQKNEGIAKIPVFLALENVFAWVPYVRHIDFFEKATRKNASIGSILQAENFFLAMIAVGSLNVNRIHSLHDENKNYKRGTPLGFFTIGSSMIICFPDSFNVLVKKGERIKLGQKLLQIK